MSDKKETIVSLDSFKKEREFSMTISNIVTGEDVVIDESFITELQSGDVDLNDARCKFLIKGMLLEYIELLAYGADDEPES